MVAALAALNACDDSQTTRPDCCMSVAEPESALVSEPLSGGVPSAPLRLRTLNAASASDGNSSNLGAAERLVYVSLPSGAYPTGTTAIIRNTANQPSVAQPMVDGGFDPIAIPAGVGDTVEITIRAGAVVLATIARAVPRSRRPGVVRTNPPKGKRDVALNSRVTIIFSEPIVASTVTSSSITLSRNGTPISGSIQVFAGGLAAEFVPSTPLASNTAHRLFITQDLRDIEGDALEADVSVEFTTGSASTPPVTSVEVAPAEARLEMGDVLGDSVQLAATLRSAQGVVTDREVIWSTSDPTVAVVSSRGLVTARGPGLATITAFSEGQQDSAQITVVPIPVARINIGPVNPAVDPGGTVVLNATTYDRNNQLVSRRERQWRSSDVGVATVDQRGLVTGISAGTATITVTSEGALGATTIVVGPGLGSDRVEIAPRVMAVAVGGAAQLTARVYRCNASIVGSCSEATGQPVTWSSANPQVATVDQNGRLTAHRTGAVGVTARANDIQGLAPVTVLPAPALTFKSLTAGNHSTCGLTPAGTAYCWGDNFFGQLGLGELGIGSGLRPGWTPAAVGPLPVAGGLTFASISAGSWHTCGLTTSGVAYCWGMASAGRLGRTGSFGAETCEITQQTGTARSSCVAAPLEVIGVPPFQALTAGGIHTCALTAAGAAYCWGSDRYGEVGDAGGVTGHPLPPTPVAGEHIFAQVSAGGAHVCGITRQGEAYCWGNNYTGQLGDGSHTNRDMPVRVAGGLSFKGISAGVSHTCGVTIAGNAYCWGENYYGQLGNGSNTGSNVPVAVRGEPVVTVAAGTSSSCGITSGVAYCWGGNWEGTLGDGSRSSRTIPVAVSDGLPFVAIEVGSAHTCGLTSGQVLYCWGWNLLGQLGDGSAADRVTPARVVGQP